MDEKEERRARALEIAVLMLGKTEHEDPSTMAKLVLKDYLLLAGEIELYIEEVSQYQTPR